MVSKKYIENIINKSIKIIQKCGPTIGEMHTLLDGWTQDEKDTLLKYAMGINIDRYHNFQEDMSEEEIFNLERKIFDNLNKTQRDNILKYLTPFDENDYIADDDVGYPSHDRGVLEEQQELVQEDYFDNEIDNKADMVHAFDMWTGGWYEEMQDYLLHGEESLHNSWGGSIVSRDIKKSVNSIREFIKNSPGLEENTILYRGGYWDEKWSVGDVKSIPCLNSLSFSFDSAYELGIEEGNEGAYMMKVYSPMGTKGAMVNAPSFSHEFPEHEYLVDKGQKFIVLNVDSENNYAEILLL